MTDVLIVEDNAEIAGLLRDFIRRAGYSCEVTVTGEEALRFAREHEVGIVLLDIMLPGMDGFAVCDAIHKAQNTPIIVLSARVAKDDKLNALTLGADDYIEKPYDMDLLLAKIKALYRRVRENAVTDHIFGELVIDTTKRQVLKAGVELALTVKEYDLLVLLAENAGKTLCKDYLFSQVWGSDSFSEPSTLTVHIKWLRGKIECDPGNPEFIVTVWGVGYRFESGS